MAQFKEPCAQCTKPPELKLRRALLTSETPSKATCLICAIDGDEKGLDRLAKKQTHGLLGS